MHPSSTLQIVIEFSEVPGTVGSTWGYKSASDKVPACEEFTVAETCEQPTIIQGRGGGGRTPGTPALLLLRDCHKWLFVNVDSQISAILGGLEGHILRKKRRIYESLSTSVQNDLKPCYEGGPPRVIFPPPPGSVGSFSILVCCSPFKVFVLLCPESP